MPQVAHVLCALWQRQSGADLDGRYFRGGGLHVFFALQHSIHVYTSLDIRIYHPSDVRACFLSAGIGSGCEPEISSGRGCTCRPSSLWPARSPPARSRPLPARYFQHSPQAVSVSAPPCTLRPQVCTCLQPLLLKYTLGFTAENNKNINLWRRE